jgi:predicted protein tyrosine phosphatase
MLTDLQQQKSMFKEITGLEVKSAGISIGATVPLTRELVKWADEIYTMEFKHQQTILNMMPSAWKKVECLEIPDIYYRDQPELKQLIIEKMKAYISL